MKKLVRPWGMWLVGLLLLSGCGGGSSSKDAGPADTGPDVQKDVAGDADLLPDGPADVPGDEGWTLPDEKDAGLDPTPPDLVDVPDLGPDKPDQQETTPPPDLPAEELFEQADATVEIVDAVETADALPDADAATEDLVDVPTPPAPELYTAGDGCAVPAAYAFPGCDGVVCAGGKECMGDGVCVPAGPFMLTTGVTGSQVKPALWANPDGTFAMAWYEVPEGSAWMDIYFQLFKPDATPVGQPVKVDQDELSWARSPSVAGLPGGKYLVLWRSQEGMSANVAFNGRVISAAGQPEGNSFQLNTTTLETELGSGTNVDGPFAEMLRDEHTAVAWSGEPQAETNDVNVYARIFSPAGMPVTGELDVGGKTEKDEGSAAVAPLPGQGMMTVWQKGDLWNEYRVMASGINTSGIVTLPATELSPGAYAYEGMPAAASFEEEVALVTWQARDTPFTAPTWTQVALLDLKTFQPLGTWEVGYDSSGTYPFYAPVRAGTWGRGLIAFHSCGNPIAGPFVRRFYLDKQWLDCEPQDVGGPSAEKEQVCRYLPAVTAFQDGRFLVAWNTEFMEADNLDHTRIMLRFVR